MNLSINRQDLFTINNIREKIIKIIYWGYPTGMQGHINFSNILQNITVIEDSMVSIKNNPHPSENDFNDLSNIFSEVPGLGLSTYSKFLYFLDINFNGYKSLILDRRLIEVFRRGVFDDYLDFRNINYNNAVNNYFNYIKVTNQIANRIGTNAENIEQFLFIFGNNLKE